MKSLRAQLLVLLTAAVLLAALVQAVVVFNSAMREADAVFDYHLQQLALSLASGDLGLPGFGPNADDHNGVDYVVHAAALKHVPACEYNPFEAIKTNILGAQNIINAAIDSGVKRVIALSTDKAANPINLYGATKLCSDKLFIAGNNYAAGSETRFSVVRYGNVLASRGSVIPLFRRCRDTGVVPITDERMTRFWITLDLAVRFVLDTFKIMRGGEIFVPKLPSMRIVDLAEAIAPGCVHEKVGIRPGEKIHEVMIPVDEARNTIEFAKHYVITPQFEWWSDDYRKIPAGGKNVPDDFVYASDMNDKWLSVEEMRQLIGDES